MMYGYPGFDSEEWMKSYSQADVPTEVQRKIEIGNLKEKIDIALGSRDKQWFMELTNKLKEYEVE